MTTSRIGRGAIITLAGAAASLAGAAGAANACDNPPPEHTCSLSDNDVQWAVNGSDGKPDANAKFHSSSSFTRVTAEPVHGFTVRLSPHAVADQCTGGVDVSLASYTANGGPTWETSGTQTFVDFATVHLTTASKSSETQSLTVKLPGTPGGPCFGQIDLYHGNTKYDGTDGHPVPNHDNGINTPDHLFAAWNGSDAGGCAATPPPPVTTPTTPTTTPPPAKTTTPPSTPPTTSPTSHPSTPASSTPPSTPTPSSSTGTPGTPATPTTTPGTPTLAHTGANVGEVSMVALMFFGAGGGAMFASRKAKTAGARKH